MSVIFATNVGMMPRKAAKPENMGKRFVGANTEKTGKWWDQNFFTLGCLGIGRPQ